MCYEFERLEWLQRAEQYRRELELAEKLKKQRTTETPPKPAAPDTGREHEPVPA
jgi:hypothetical protein